MVEETVSFSPNPCVHWVPCLLVHAGHFLHSDVCHTVLLLSLIVFTSGVGTSTPLAVES